MRQGILTPLVDATGADEYGGKAAQLAAALGHGLPVPGGYALDWRSARAVAEGNEATFASLRAFGLASGPWAVRSSAIGEDSTEASFAGAHLTVLGQVGIEAVLVAIARVHASTSDPAALDYRKQRGIETAPRMGVVVQQMVDADVAGVLFTRNPVSRAAERLVEASWGLGEAVVSGLVTPDHYRLDAQGTILERTPGDKDLALRLRRDGTVEEVAVTSDRVHVLCLADAQLAALHRLASMCDRIFDASGHDIEFAFAGDSLYLLQRRPITDA